MQSKIALYLSALIVIATQAIFGRAIAQHQKSAPYPYILIDLGTFGGPNAYLNLPGQPTNIRGAVIGEADTSTSDPSAPSCHNPDCFVSQGFVWQRGVRAKLDSLPGGSSNDPFAINASGLIAGTSQTGAVDPLTNSPEFRAVLWRDGQILNLGTLPGGHESGAFAVNDRGMVAGPATNAIPDPYSCDFFICLGTQTHAFLWQDGVMRDLGTLGGPDSLPLFMNNRGQIAGVSYTSATPNPATGQPTLDPFLWEDGRMRDLGSLGGTLGSVEAMNSWGEVVGESNLAGDQVSHPYLWDGRSLKDLGTLGGDFGAATGLNDLGAVVGGSQTPGDATVHAVLWWNGAARDLGVPPGDDYGFASSINLLGQVVGNAGAFNAVGHGFLWDRGSIADLNTLVTPSALHLTEAVTITDRGEIVGLGLLPNGDQRVVMLVPARLAALEGLTSNAPAAGPTSPAAVPQVGPSRCPGMPRWHARLPHEPHLPCLGG